MPSSCKSHFLEEITVPEYYDILCLSHLRWDFVYQRPQHLLGRAAWDHRVFYVEEPVFDTDTPSLEVSPRPEGVQVLVPHLPGGLGASEQNGALTTLLDEFIRARGVSRYVCWYYTPMAMGFTENLTPLATVYDCMDELSAFTGAPPALRENEAKLFARADLVFTGGQTLYEAKRGHHPHVYAFPSSVDVPHFAQARREQSDPLDQADIPHPRLGFYGVIDERLDLTLLDGIARLRPDWHQVIIGPVVKIDPASLPQHPNIHYLDGKKYDELPQYLAGWDVATLPFARNESTRFISPTKTPEYLAAGRPVVSTSIRDVIRPYGEQGLARIADTPPEFVAAVEAVLKENPAERQRKADMFLAQMSWNKTWQRMAELIDNALQKSRERDHPCLTI